MTQPMNDGKRKRSECSEDACSTSSADGAPSTATEGTTQRRLRSRREQDAVLRHKLEERCRDLKDQQAHVQAQLEQLEGLEEGGVAAGGLGVSDLQQQLRCYEEQHREAVQQLARLEDQFKEAVADILHLPASSQQLDAAMQEQRMLKEAAVSAWGPSAPFFNAVIAVALTKA